ncbi:hypothetical protein, partial [Pandoraea sputorum]|uniref:hypothetical protein n=2 Tax=Pandoraea sputorum TaxID=93222 RepID=UPI00355696D4
SSCPRSNSDTTTSIPLRPIIASGLTRFDHRTQWIYVKLFLGRNTSLLNALTVTGFLLVWEAGVCLMGWLVLWNGAPARKDVLVISTAIRHALQERGA